MSNATTAKIENIDTGLNLGPHATLDHGVDPAPTIDQLNARLMDACANGDKNKAVSLLDQGASVHALDAGGYTPLHWAALSRANDSPRIVKLLIDKAADLDALNLTGKTAFETDQDTRQVLIRARAYLETRSKEGMTALNHASRGAVVKSALNLLACGSDIEAKDDKGNTPLLWAVQLDSKSMALALIAHGADTTVLRNLPERTAEFLEHKPTFYEGLTAAHAAVRAGMTKRLRNLLDAGANPDAVVLGHGTLREEIASCEHDDVRGLFQAWEAQRAVESVLHIKDNTSALSTVSFNPRTRPRG